MATRKNKFWSVSSLHTFSNQVVFCWKTIGWVISFATVFVVQLLSHVQLFATPWTVARQASLSFTYLPEFAQTHVHWVSDAIQLSRPLSPSSLPALNVFQHQGLFQWVTSLHQVTKVLELQRWPQILYYSSQWEVEFNLPPFNQSWAHFLLDYRM